MSTVPRFLATALLRANVQRGVAAVTAAFLPFFLAFGAGVQETATVAPAGTLLAFICSIVRREPVTDQMLVIAEVMWPGGGGGGGGWGGCGGCGWTLRPALAGAEATPLPVAVYWNASGPVKASAGL